MNELAQPVNFLADQFSPHGLVLRVESPRSETLVKLVDHLAFKNHGLAGCELARGLSEIELHVVGRVEFAAELVA